MIQTDKLAKMLSDVGLRKTIEECVITVKDGVATIHAIDMTSSLFVQASAELDIADVQLGIGNLELLYKSMNMLRGVQVKVGMDNVEDNRIQFTPKTGSKINFLLTEVDLIPTYDPEFTEIGDVVGEELKSYPDGIDLTESVVSDLIQAMSLFDHNSVVFSVSKKGKVTAHSGNENEHQVESVLGKMSADSAFSIKVYAKHLSPVLSAIDFKCEPKLLLKEGVSVAIHTTATSWMLEPIADAMADGSDE